jgi:hypothetical protein
MFAQPSTQQELAIMSKRCNYYFLRARAGDHTIRGMLLTRNPQEQNITGFEKCANIISEYLKTSNISPEEKNFYENLNQHLATIIKQIPPPEPQPQPTESETITTDNVENNTPTITPDNLSINNPSNDGNNIIQITPNSRMEIILSE